MTTEEKEIGKKFREKYPDVNEAVKHTDELQKYDLGLFINSYFKYQNGKLEQIKANENGNPIEGDWRNYETYEVVFRIRDDKILEIDFDNGAALTN